MSKPGIIRFAPHGPADTGLVEWAPIDQNELETAIPVQRGHIYHQEESAGYMAGVWDCTPMTMKICPYPVHEFMFVLEGSITMVLANGEEITTSAGEAFVIPKGLPCQWKQPNYARKFFMIFGDPGAPTSDQVSEQGIISLQPLGPPGGMEKVVIDDRSGFVGEIPVQHQHSYFEDRSGQLNVGLWDSSPFETARFPQSGNELMCLLEGSMTLIDQAGKEHRFKAGEAAYVPHGTEHSWKSTEYVRKFYAICKPAGADRS